jgi:hypothetical protein
LHEKPPGPLALRDLMEAFSSLGEWERTRDQKRLVLASVVPDIRVADYKVDSLGLNFVLLSNENTRSDTGSSMNRAGKLSDMAARAMATAPSFSGWRMTSNTLSGNSGSSSKKRTRYERVRFRPDRGIMPPPIIRDRVMRRAERPSADKSAGWIEHTGNSVNRRRFQSFCAGQRREDGRHALGQHGLA